MSYDELIKRVSIFTIAFSVLGIAAMALLSTFKAPGAAYAMDGIAVSADTVSALEVSEYEEPAVVVVIDPAHGGEDTGNGGFGVSEADAVYIISERLAESLEKRGIGARLTRGREENPDTVKRLSLLRDENAGLYISVRAGGDAHTRVTSGAMVLAMNEEGLEASARIFEAMSRSKELRLNERNDSSVSGNFAEKLPAVSLEVGFLTNKKDAQLLSDDGYIGSMAEAVSEGIEGFLEQ